MINQKKRRKKIIFLMSTKVIGKMSFKRFKKKMNLMMKNITKKEVNKHMRIIKMRIRILLNLNAFIEHRK